MSRSPVRLTELTTRLKAAGLVESAAAEDVRITGVSDDSRSTGSGDLFCAWAGTEVDAHGFVVQAEQAGAVAALVERPVPEATIPQVVVRDGRRAAAHAAAAVFGDPADEVLMVGVTGTNGKTTTVWLLRHLLRARHAAASLGTLGTRLDAEEIVERGESLTTPGPVELARTLRSLVDHGVRAVATEASSHALDQGRVDAVRFDAAVFTNLSRDHLDYHGDDLAYRAAKLHLADLLRPDGTLVVNVDDPAWSALADREARTIRYGTRSLDADVRAEAVEATRRGTRFRMLATGGERTVELPLLGSFNVVNALGAAAACIAVGLSFDEIADRLETVPQVPGRLERIADRPCPVLRDYAHSPDALERALTALRPLINGRLIVVFGAGGDRDRGKRPAMGAVAVEHADVAIVTSDNPRTEDPSGIVDDIIEGMHGREHVRQVDRRAAIRRALELAGAEDLILLAGKGHETYQVMGTERRPFDEKTIVQALLAGAVQEVDA